MKERFKQILFELYLFLTSKIFVKNCLIFVLTFGILFLCLFWWLHFYTNHGNRINVNNLIGLKLEDAVKQAEEASFRILVSDSLHIIGKEGGTIVEQNPLPGAEVKENRTIYLKIAKHKADQIPLDKLPVLYGKDYRNIKRLLETRYQIKSEIIGRRFDRGPDNHVLEVKYNGNTIVNAVRKKKGINLDKGGTLEFVLSQRSSAPVRIPDLVCKTYGSATFNISSSGLKIGKISSSAAIKDSSNAYIVSQSPSYISGGTMYSGQRISLVLAPNKPKSCY